MENLSFMFKHFNETVFQSGISQLINHSAVHDTHYKNIFVAYSNDEGHISLNFRLSYVTRSGME
jgi:hypothetical protein